MVVPEVTENEMSSMEVLNQKGVRRETLQERKKN